MLKLSILKVTVHCVVIHLHSNGRSSTVAGYATTQSVHHSCCLSDDNAHLKKDSKLKN